MYWNTEQNNKRPKDQNKLSKNGIDLKQYKE